MSCRSRASRWLVTTAVIACCAVLTPAPPLAAEQFGRLFGRGPKGVTFITYKDAANRFTLEYPEKDWRVMPTPGSSLVILAQKEFEATVVVDYKRLDVPLAPSDVTSAFVDFETEAVKERQHSAKDVKAEIVDAPSGRGALIKYSVAGLRGAEQVMQFSVPKGQDLYRIIGSMRDPLVAKYEPIIMHVIQSFIPTTPAAPKH
jgi:hypothetical protein